MDYSENYILSKLIHTVKTVAMCQDSCILSRQLQTVKKAADSGLTGINFQDNVFNRPGVAGAALHTASLLIN